jgi:aromatic-L-amino-acid/L-tryptophan decarboxylase
VHRAALATTPETANAATDALIDAANASGEALFTRTVLDGRSVLRISVGARRPNDATSKAAWHLLSRHTVPGQT